MFCKVTTLYVGQGGMNLIEIYDNKNRLVNLSLIDCGGSSIDETNEAIAYVQNKIMQRRATVLHEESVFLDNLIITHRDADHINLFSKIFMPLIKGNGIFEIDDDSWCSLSDGNNVYIYQMRKKCALPNSMKYDQYIQHFDENFSIAANSKFFKYKSRIDHSVSIDCTIENQATEINFDWSKEWSNIYCNINEKSIKILCSYYNCLAKEKFITICGEKTESTLDTFCDFINLYKEQIKNILAEIYSFPADVLESILSVMGKINLSIEDIEKVFEGEEPRPTGWVGSTFIGGNPQQKTNGYNVMRDYLFLHSANSKNFSFENIETGATISLYGNYRLHVLKRLCLDEMNKKASPGEKNNGTSLVLALVENGNEGFQKVVFPGDANVHTFTQWGAEYQEQLGLFAGADWLAPHHGSDSFKVKNTPNEECVFYQILQDSEAQTMIISAGERNFFKHPYKSFIELMEAHYISTEISAEEHNIRCNDRDSRTGTLDSKSVRYPLYTLCTGVPGEYSMWDGPQSDNQILLADSRVFRKPQREPQEVPAPGLFFYRK